MHVFALATLLGWGFFRPSWPSWTPRNLQNGLQAKILPFAGPVQKPILATETTCLQKAKKEANPEQRQKNTHKARGKTYVALRKPQFDFQRPNTG